MTTEELPKRARWQNTPEYTAFCRSCMWTTFERNGKGLAAQHHDSTGHIVEVHESITTFYGEDAADQPRWWKAPPG